MHTRKKAAKQGAEQEVVLGERGGAAHIDGKHVHYQVREERVNGDGKERVDGKGQPLAPEAEQKDRDVKHEQEQPQLQVWRRHLVKQHRCAGDPAVVESHRIEEDVDSKGVHDAGDKEDEKVPEFETAPQYCSFRGHGRVADGHSIILPT